MRTSPPARVDVLSTGYAVIKGTQHTPRPGAVFDAAGPADDRRYCLVDVERRVVLKTVQHPALVAVTAGVSGDVLSVTLPSSESVSAEPAPVRTMECDYWGRRVAVDVDCGAHAQLMSDYLGKEVALGRVRPGDVVYGQRVSIVTTASLNALGDSAAVSGLSEQFARFRPTFLIATSVPFAEDGWAGAEVQAGPVRLRLGGPIPRCAVCDLHPRTGARDVRLLRAMARCRPLNDRGEPHFGIFAEVVG